MANEKSIYMIALSSMVSAPPWTDEEREGLRVAFARADDTARTFVLDAYERVAQGQCDICASGEKPKVCGEPGHYPYEHIYPNGDVVACDAAEVRALKDSLVQEPVSTS